MAADALARALDAAGDSAPALVSVMLANNELGTMQPVAALAALARARGAPFHTDAVQAVGRIPVDVRDLGVDLLSIAGHKFGAPKGVGALWVRRGLALQPQSIGGRQERGRRAGTENVPAIEGFGVAARLGRRGSWRPKRRGMAALRDRLEQGILAQVPGTAVNGDPGARVPNTTNISFEGVEGESLVIGLDLEGIAVSTGSACSSGTLEPSHVLRAMGLPPSRVAERGPLQPRARARPTPRSIACWTWCPAVVGRLRARRRRPWLIARACASSSRCRAASTRRWRPRCSSTPGHDVVGVSMQLYDAARRATSGSAPAARSTICTTRAGWPHAPRHPPLHRQPRAAVRGDRGRRTSSASTPPGGRPSRARTATAS